MENETRQKQAPGQGHSRIETMIHEDDPGSSGPEVDLESISERWRQEKRQLKAEIERLERAAAEKTPDTSKSWETEKAALETEVSRLQHAVGELIERSNNPKRASMSAHDDLQVKLNAAIHAKERALSEYQREKAAWESEKTRMNAEAEQLRLMVQGKFPRAKHVVESRSKDAKESREKELEARIAAIQKELDQERSSAKHQIQRLERQISESHQGKELEARITALQRELDHERSSAKHQPQKQERPASEPSPGVDAEMNRVQMQIAEITKKINDPATELSTVIRKNVELETLNAYLRGMQFSQGNGKGR